MIITHSLILRKDLGYEQKWITSLCSKLNETFVRSKHLSLVFIYCYGKLGVLRNHGSHVLQVFHMNNYSFSAILTHFQTYQGQVAS